MDPLADEDNRIAVAPGVFLAASKVRFTFARSGGPGGQNVNKVATQAVMTVELDDLAAVLPADAMARLKRHGGRFIAGEAGAERLVIASSESRSQLANRKACLAKLRTLVVGAMQRPKRRKATRPSKGAVQRRLDEKKAVGERKAARRVDRRPGDL